MHPRRRLASWLVPLVAGALVVAGCGGGSSGTPSRPIDAAALKKALISLDDLGDSFVVSEDDDDSDAETGCLDFDGIGPRSDTAPVAAASYEAIGAVGMPLVASAITRFSSVAEARSGLAGARRVLARCHRVDRTDDRGRMHLTVTSDDDRSGPAADDQVNVHASGIAEHSSGTTLPMSIHLSMIRVDRYVVMCGFGTLSTDAGGDADRVATLALAKLVAVLEHRRPPAGHLGLEPVDLGALLADPGASA